MTIESLSPLLPVSAVDRLRWGIRDGLTMIGRQLVRVRRHPGELIAGLIFPAVMVLLFGYVFGSAIRVPGGGNYREYLMPGLFTMTAFTSVMVNMLLVSTDASRGVMDRFRSMPIIRAAVPFGQSGFDLLLGLENLAVMMVCGLIVGWRVHQGPGQAAAAVGLIVLMRYALSWVGIYLGLVVKNQEVADQFMPLIFPITMISNTFVPTSGMPAWLRTISDWNPVSALVAALRRLFGNPGAAGHDANWPVAHPITAVLLWSAILLAVFVPLSIRQYRIKGR